MNFKIDDCISFLVQLFLKKHDRSYMPSILYACTDYPDYCLAIWEYICKV